MSKTPPIPAEQRSFTDDKVRDRLRSAEPARREAPDLKTDREIEAERVSPGQSR